MAEKLVYYKSVEEVPTRGEAVSIYECEPEEDELWVRRFVTHIEESGDYDRLEVDWDMQLCEGDIEEVSREDFQELWDLNGT
ncbi:MAG: hypothetical protein ACQEP7_00650 [bacterium]